MSKFKNSIDKISLDENDKRRILNNILNHKEEKRSFSFNRFALAACTFIIAFSLTIGTGYAFVKYFNLDTKFKEMFNIDDEVAEKIDGNEINVKKEFENMTINILQSIVTENTIYIRLDIEGKKELQYLQAGLLSYGNKFDESIINITKYDDGSIEFNTNEKAPYESHGMSLIDDGEYNNTLKNSYLLSFDYPNLNNLGDMTLRLYFDENLYHDISFKIDKNNIHQKKIKINKNIQSKNNLIMKTNFISISTYSIIINYNVNDFSILSNFEEYGEQFTNITLNYKDGTSEQLYIIINYVENDDGTYTSAFGYYNSSFISIENVESVTINNNTFEI